MRRAGHENGGGLPANGALDVLISKLAHQLPIPLTFVLEGLTLSPDGTKAFVASGLGGSGKPVPLKVVDLQSRTITDGPNATVQQHHVSLAALAGDRMVVRSPKESKLEVIDFGKPVPKWWDLTVGLVSPVSLPVTLPGAGNIGAWLGKTPGAPGSNSSPLSSISQLVPVTAGCPFEFSFYGSATAIGAAADVIWRGDNCAGSRTDSIPIAAKDDLTFCGPMPLELHRSACARPKE